MRNYPGCGRLILLLVLAAIVPGTAMAQGGSGDELPTFKSRVGQEEAPSDLIIKFEEDASSSARVEARRDVGLEKKKDLDLIEAELDEVEGQSVERAISDLERRSDVEYATPNRKVYATGYADEPQFGQLWGLDNMGQTIDGSPGTANMDVNGKQASGLTQGDPNLVVAVIDDGVDFSHPDLADRAWRNPGESGLGKETNGIDDDGNGHEDDVYGWDFVNDNKTVYDSPSIGHGTHVSGTIAASVNDQGVVGVAPNVKIMGVKFLGANGSGSLSDAILAIGYAKQMGARISNNSWGYLGSPDPALEDAIKNSRQLFVAAAGNESNNNEHTNHAGYPATYDLPNILSVAAINNRGNRAGFSNYGATTVDISAPGVSILSSVPGTPERPAAALTSVGSSGGKAVTIGFGADEIGDSAKRASFFQKAFDAVGSQEVVLVDDDGSSGGVDSDVGPTLATAIQTATGSAPQVIDVPEGASAPTLPSDKTVVWATGQDYGCGATAALTPDDKTQLTNFLDGGGKLILNGLNTLFCNETSSFVTGTLALNAQRDVPGKTTFNGSSGTAFAGESYDLNSSTANSNLHDVLTPASSAATTQGIYPSVPRWQSWDGTSMATPHVTGAAALLASVDSGLLNNPAGLKKILMNTGKPVPATKGKTVTGDMIDARAAVQADTAPPAGSVLINNGASSTKRTAVTLNLSASDNAGGSGVTKMRFSNNGTNWSGWRTYATNASWTLTSGKGAKTVYAEFRDGAGNVSARFSDEIRAKQVG